MMLRILQVANLVLFLLLAISLSLWAFWSSYYPLLGLIFGIIFTYVYAVLRLLGKDPESWRIAMLRRAWRYLMSTVPRAASLCVVQALIVAASTSFLFNLTMEIRGFFQHERQAVAESFKISSVDSSFDEVQSDSSGRFVLRIPRRKQGRTLVVTAESENYIAKEQVTDAVDRARDLVIEASRKVMIYSGRLECVGLHCGPFNVSVEIPGTKTPVVLENVDADFTLEVPAGASFIRVSAQSLRYRTEGAVKVGRGHAASFIVPVARRTAGVLVDLRHSSAAAWNPVSFYDEWNESLRNGDNVRLIVQIEEPMYLYLIWIDQDGNIIPLFPWKDREWSRPAQEKRVDQQLEYPAGNLALPISDISREGMESVLLLAHEDPLPLNLDLSDRLASWPKDGVHSRAKLSFIHGEREESLFRDRGLGGAVELDSSLLAIREILEKGLSDEVSGVVALTFPVRP